MGVNSCSQKAVISENMARNQQILLLISTNKCLWLKTSNLYNYGVCKRTHLTGQNRTHRTNKELLICYIRLYMFMFVPLAFPFIQLFLWDQELSILQGQHCANCALKLNKGHKQFQPMFCLNVFFCYFFYAWFTEGRLLSQKWMVRLWSPHDISLKSWRWAKGMWSHTEQGIQYNWIMHAEPQYLLYLSWAKLQTPFFPLQTHPHTDLVCVVKNSIFILL